MRAPCLAATLRDNQLLFQMTTLENSSYLFSRS
jgi:hypothetical protein